MGARQNRPLITCIWWFVIALLNTETGSNISFAPGIQQNTTLLQQFHIRRLKDKIQREINKHRGNTPTGTQTPEPLPVPQQSRPAQASLFVLSEGRGKNTLQFPLSRRRNTSDSEITRADLWILVWRKEKKHKKKNFRQLRKRRKGKLIRIRIYSVMNKESTKVAELRTKVQKTKWYKISLPISLLKNLESSQKQLMVLRVECKRCNRKTQIIFPRRPKAKCRKTGRKNKDSKRGMNKDSKGKHRRRGCGTARLSPPAKHSKHRPFIVIEQGWKGSRRLRRSAQVMTSCGTSSSSEGVLGVLTGRSPANSCCKVSSYVDFSDMDLDDDIVSPAGYTAATCVGTCARRRRNISSSRSSRNRRSRRVSRRSRRRSRGRGKGHGGRNSNRGYCTADESSPLTVWIFNDDHDLVRAKLPGLVVRSCRCT